MFSNDPLNSSHHQHQHQHQHTSITANHHCKAQQAPQSSTHNHYNHLQKTPTSFKMLPIVKAAAAPKVVPVLLTIGSATIVGSYVRSQLKTQSRTFDRQFSQYNTKESEAVRAKTFDGKVPDPRTSFFNILGW
ncbi:hypothetical protein NCS55_00201700 [Fusarium keratoplasticum]|nr:hypothetical protein NCS55_00201700 [Fusarium keratoplasticum]